MADTIPLAERLQVLAQYALPKQALPASAGWVASDSMCR